MQTLQWSSVPVFVPLVLSAIVLACDGTALTDESSDQSDPEMDTGSSGHSTAGLAGAATVAGSSPQGVGGGSAGSISAGAGGTGGTTVAPGEPREVPYRAIAISSSILHTCVLLDDHQVKCFGNNFMGQLGTGDTQSRPYSAGLADEPVLDLGSGRTVLALSSGRYTTCAILDDRSVKCWGYGGQNGTDDGSPRGDEPGEMGDALPTVDLGAGRTAMQLALGYDASFALLDDGNIRRWTGGVAPTTVAVGADEVVELVGILGTAVARYADGSVGVLGEARSSMGQAKAVSLVSDAMSTACARLDGTMLT